MLKPEGQPGEPDKNYSGKHVSCDGGGGALGHPLIWLTFGQDGTVTCPYCSKTFDSQLSE